MTKYLPFKKLVLLIVGSFLVSINAHAQNIATPDIESIPFAEVPGSVFNIRGELKMISNSIVGPNQNLRDENGISRRFTPDMDYNGNETNNRKVFGYINIDGDDTTFSSSSAVLETNNPGCAKVVYAGLYWAASYYVDRTNASGTTTSGDYAKYADLPLADNRPDFRTLKFKPAWATEYIDILPSTTQVLYDGYRNTATNPNDIAVRDMPYACYANVTDIFTSAPNGTVVDGEYTIANMRASIGRAGNNAAGISGGWVLVVTYEDPSLSNKFISTNNGFLNVSADNSNAADKIITYSGLSLPPAAVPIRARYAIAALEGDFDLEGDQLRILRQDGSEYALRTFPANPANNFFDSSISVDGQYVDRPTRIPASRNTLGFDADIFDIPNQTNGQNWLIANGQADVKFRTTTSSDRYSTFFNAFQVEFTEPELNVTARVLDDNLVDITGGDVTLGQDIFYELTIENVGNENIINARIQDILPANVDFKGMTAVQADPGINYTYDITNREFNITIDDTVIEQFDAPLSIRFGVQTVAICEGLADRCDNEIANAAFSTYTGEITGIVKDASPSAPEFDICNVAVTGNTTVFLTDLGVCDDGVINGFLCAGDLGLSAAAGFANYTWTDVTNGPGSPGTVLGTSQTLTISAPGRYRVDKTDPVCADAFEIHEVTTVDDITNPIIDIVSNLPIGGNVQGTTQVCPISGAAYPELFLCGAGTTIDLDANVIGTTSITWERLDPAACPSAPRTDACPTVDAICESSWTIVSTDRVFTLSQAGEYRITAIFDNNCPVTFFFKAFQNNFEPDLVIVRDIICDVPGVLRVQNSSDQYEYQLVDPSGATTAFQNSPEFVGLTVEGAYTVNARQNNGLPTACVFQATAVIKILEPTINVISQNPDCQDGTGQISIQITDAQPNYVYNIVGLEPGSTFSNSFGPTVASDYIFTELNPGAYTIEVLSFDENCMHTEVVTIAESLPITAEIGLFRELSCEAGLENAIIKVDNITGGSGNYEWSFDPLEPFTAITSNLAEIQVPTAGTYTVYIRNQETENCVTGLSPITVAPVDTIEITLSSASNVVCKGDSNGSLEGNVTGGTPPYTYALELLDSAGVINEQTDVSPEFTFDNLAPGTYQVIVSDANACGRLSSSVSISEAALPLTSTIEVNQATELLGARITVTASGGLSPYRFSLNNSTPGTSGVFDDLRAGNYSITIEDSSGCRLIEDNIVLATPEPIAVTLNLENTTNLCYAQNTASIDATVSGGSGQYSYALTGTDYLGGIVDVDSQTSSLFSNLIAGTYQYIVNSTGFNASITSFEIVNPPEFLVETNSTNVVCNGDDNGTVEITVQGGTPPYSFSISSSPNVILSGVADTIANQHIFENLVPGNYEILAQDVNECSQVINVEIAEPDPLLASIASVIAETCSGNADGAVTLQISGGTPPYETNITNNDIDFVIDALAYDTLPAGTTSVFVRDANNCRVTLSVEIPEGVVLNATLSESTECPVIDPNTGTTRETSYFIDFVLGNNAITTDIIYTIQGINGTPNPATATNMTGKFSVVPGEYEGTMSHVSGCAVVVGTVVIEGYQPMDVTTTVTNPTISSENGQITVLVTQGKAPYTYSLDNGNPVATNTFTNVPVGKHNIKVFDSLGCASEINEVVVVEGQKNPIVAYASEIILCTITGQSYPVVTIQDEKGEELALSFGETVSIVWQKLNEITCDIELQDNCPTSDSSCSSDWFDIATGDINTMTEAGEYRVVVNFANRASNAIEIYYFRVVKNLSDTATEFSLFPNPAKDLVTLNKAIELVEVFDVMGKLVLKTSQNPYNVGALHNGIYFVRVITQENKEYVVKLIKK